MRDLPQRLTGVFLAQLDDAYQTAVWRGIDSRVRELGMGAVCFVGHRIHSPVASEATANIAYRIADSRTIDGLIVVSSAIATFLSPEETVGLFSARPGIPHVSVGLRVPGVPSVTASGSEGVMTVVRHLVRDHGLRRFALIRGPAGHPEAAEREWAFRATLAEEGLGFDERLAAEGTFLRASGASAARSLLDTGLPFDAVVCMNDRMALAAMEVFRGAGRRVPDDVAIVGFDGIEEGRYVTPPLTTVMQPLNRLGSSAVDLLEDLMAGGKPRDTVLTCTPVIRQSCGCPPRRRYDAGLTAIPASASAEERAAIEELVGRASGGDGDGFVLVLTRALAETTIAGGAPGKWNDYLSLIGARVEAAEAAAGAPVPGRAALFEFARVLVGEAEARLQAARRVSAEERLGTLRSISASLAGAFEMPVMLGRLEAGLERLGIGGGYIALFDDPSGEAAWSRLVMAPRQSAEKPLPARGTRFRTRRILPSRVDPSWRHGTWVLEPLVSQNEPLGYILLPGGAEEPAVYGTLREQVASALKGALLLDQVLSHERRLQSEVARRTAELTRANEELTREVERRRRLEREVSEISNRTMQRIGQDLHDDLCQHLAGIAMLASVLRGSIADHGDAVAAVEHIGALLTDSIARTRQIARGLHPAGLEENGLVAAVEELVDAARRNYAASIEFRAAPDFRLSGTDRALQVYRIVQEALSNALKHSRSDRIEVKLFREEPAPASRGRRAEERRTVLVAEVTDYGGGIPLAIDGNGMGLRIMRYRAETAGAELRIERLAPGTRVSCRIDCSPGER
jgi:DNA-binding LacI/PurR family transcriptional regulator/signal transduction histidine kinase